MVFVNMDYQRDAHRVHLVAYHFVWCPKRRKRVLVGRIAEVCERVIREVCVEKHWEVIRLAIQPDHVHLFVRVNPDTPAALVARWCKGRTSRVLRQAFPELLRLPSLWTRSYFVSTVGNVSQKTVDRYIAAQKGN